MKRLLFFFFLLCLQPKAFADDFSRAQKVLEWIRTAQGDSLVALFHPCIRQTLPPDAINKIWQRLELRAGAFSQQEEWSSTQRDTLHIDQCQLAFEKQKVRFSLLTDSCHFIVGFHFNPVNPSEEGIESNPERRKREKDYVERDTFVTHGRIKLPATLCLPKQPCAQCPIIVMVHGLGPIDKDGSLGPNKPYREVAHRFATHGIATLRYDKRSFVYGTRALDFGGQMNYDSEVVDDALEALRLAATFPEVDTSRIYLLGHSLGGMLAPRIAMLSSTPLSGVIYVAGAARKLEDWLRAQFRYIAQLQNSNLTEADSLTQVIYSKLPESYRSFADEYNPVGTARGLHLPMLFLQGGHDFQVTDTDFLLWKKGLEGCENVKFIWFDNCDNLLREIPDMAVPEIYMRPGSISQKALDAVVSFVGGGGASTGR